MRTERVTVGRDGQGGLRMRYIDQQGLQTEQAEDGERASASREPKRGWHRGNLGGDVRGSDWSERGFALALRASHVSETVFAATMRHLDPPVVVRIHEGRVLLDLRTIPPTEDVLLAQLLRQTLELEHP